MPVPLISSKAGLSTDRYAGYLAEIVLQIGILEFEFIAP